MSAMVPDGQYYGEVTRTRRVGDLVLSETRYASGAVVPRHTHASPLLCLVVSGAFVEQSRGVSRTLGSGWVLFHPEDEPHSHRFDAPRTRCFSLQLGPRWRAAAAPEADLRLGAPREEPRGQLSWIARQLHEEFSRRDGASPLVIEGLALAIVGELNRIPAPRETGRPAWIGRARDLLEARICEPVRLTELASELGVNPSHLSRAFRRAYGVSLSAWLRRRRVELACAALADPAASLAQVAHGVGFADQSHLCRSFRQVTGLTPGAWRRRR